MEQTDQSKTLLLPSVFFLQNVSHQLYVLVVGEDLDSGLSIFKADFVTTTVVALNDRMGHFSHLLNETENPPNNVNLIGLIVLA